MKQLGPESRSILEAGRSGDDPSAADRARVRRALSRAIAAGGAAGATAVAGSAAKGASGLSIGLGGKLVGALLLVGAVGAGVALRSGGSAPPPTPARAAAIEAPARPGAPPAADAPLAVDAPRAAPPADSSPAVGAPPADPTPAAAPQAGDAPLAAAPLRGAPRAAMRAAPVAAEPDPLTLLDETRRLREAHGALQEGDPEKALALLDEQAAGGRELREERAAARVLALCKLGRLDEAAAARDRFLRENPRSPLADRVRASCPAADR